MSMTQQLREEALMRFCKLVNEVNYLKAMVYFSKKSIAELNAIYNILETGYAKWDGQTVYLSLPKASTCLDLLRLADDITISGIREVRCFYCDKNVITLDDNGHWELEDGRIMCGLCGAKEPMTDVDTFFQEKCDGPK